MGSVTSTVDGSSWLLSSAEMPPMAVGEAQRGFGFSRFGIWALPAIPCRSSPPDVERLSSGNLTDMGTPVETPAMDAALSPTRGHLAVPWLRILVVIFLAAVVRTAPVFAFPGETLPPAPGQPLEIRVRPLPAGVDTIKLEPDGEGGHWYVLEMVDGSKERVRPRDLAERVYTDNRDRRWYFAILNITSPIGMAWVFLGLLAQVVFMGRMVVQWVVSERRGRSVVPVAFWWMSLVGASMLLTYFVWRRDIVGILGQSAGWVIYSRNLWLIYREQFVRSLAKTLPTPRA